MKIWVNLEYEGLPDLCSTCKAIGHTSSNCRRNEPRNGVPEQPKEKSRGRSRARKIWRRKSAEPTIPVTRVLNRISDDLNIPSEQQPNQDVGDTMNTSGDPADTPTENTTTEILDSLPYEADHAGDKSGAVVTHHHSLTPVNTSNLQASATPLTSDHTRSQSWADQIEEEEGQWTKVTGKKNKSGGQVAREKRATRKPVRYNQ